MTGAGSLTALATGASVARPPWIPLLGTVAADLVRVDQAAFTGNSHAHASALLQAADALHADVITVGLGADPAVGADAVRRLRPVLAGRGVAGCLTGPDVSGARAYCEAGAGMILIVSPDRSAPGRFRILANACAFYRALAVLVAPELDHGVAVAAGLGLHGAVVAVPRGDEPGVIGGGVSPRLEVLPDGPPRPQRFFWAFPGEVPAAGLDLLAALGRHLTSTG